MWKWNLSSPFLWLVMVSVTIWRFISALRYDNLGQTLSAANSKEQFEFKNSQSKITCLWKDWRRGWSHHSLFHRLNFQLKRSKKTSFLTGENLDYPDCCETSDSLVLLSCSHSVCEDCLMSWWSKETNTWTSTFKKSFSKQRPPLKQELKLLGEGLPQ